VHILHVKICDIKPNLHANIWSTWCFSDCALRTDYILITNLMHWLLFIHKILLSSTCFEPQVFIFRMIQLYTCSIWYCHSLWEFLVACRYAVYRQATRNSHREWQYHMLHVYNSILLKMKTWGSKHVEENSILWINNNQCIKLVINIQSSGKISLYPYRLLMLHTLSVNTLYCRNM